jgi:hypothetical protein
MKLFVLSLPKVSCSSKTCNLSLHGSIIPGLEIGVLMEIEKSTLEFISRTKYISTSLACKEVWKATYCNRTKN